MSEILARRELVRDKIHLSSARCVAVIGGNWLGPGDAAMVAFMADSLVQRKPAPSARSRVLVWHPTISLSPAYGDAVVWLGPCGEQVAGTYLGESNWVPCGQRLPVVYTPGLWRLAD